MTSASNPMITRCPKCGTAFRVTQSQLQSAKGVVRCGSCLNVFKAQDYLVAVKTEATTAPATPQATTPVTTTQVTATTATSPLAARQITLKKPDFSATSTIDQSESDNTDLKTSAEEEPDDLLISDSMDEQPKSSSKYDFEGFLDIDLTPVAEVSLFERKQRDKDESDDAKIDADESWAEMLIEDEDDDTPDLKVVRQKSDEELADEALEASSPIKAPNPTETTSKPMELMFSIVGETSNSKDTEDDEFIINPELMDAPTYSGFQPKDNPSRTPESSAAEPVAASEDNNKRQVKTQPKIRAYDGSRTALLMNIMPAPIEFTAKRMRRWHQQKLWAVLSVIGLICLAVQIAWFKFDSLSRIEPYRTAYLFLCPYVGCQIPALIDTRQIITSNLVVREHPQVENALAVDVMLVNSAPFDQPFPDLVLVFNDMDNRLVASRRFTPKDYLGGELAGAELMPQNQKVYITLDIVDPGADAVSYRIYIPH